MSLLKRAIAIAVEAHRGKEDKAGRPYVLHPLRVMLRMETEACPNKLGKADVHQPCPSWLDVAVKAQVFTSQLGKTLSNSQRTHGQAKR